MVWLRLLIQYPIVLILLTEQVYSEAGVSNLVCTSLKKWKPLIRIVEHLRTPSCTRAIESDPPVPRQDIRTERAENYDDQADCVLLNCFWVLFCSS
jgi:hypothetical protein